MAKIKNPLTIVGTAGGGSSDDYNIDGLVDGTLTKFTMPAGKTTIAPYRCYNFTSLTTVDLTGAETIGDYAFNNCYSVNRLVLPPSVTEIGRYAFASLGDRNGGTTFEYNTQAVGVNIDDYAFNDAALNKLRGKFLTIGQYAFASCSKLTEIDIECGEVDQRAFYQSAITKFSAKIDGDIKNYAFSNLFNVSYVNFEATKNITAIGSYAFSCFATERSNPESNIIELDFRKATFKTINPYSFGGISSSSKYKLKHMKLRFPSTVNTISANAFSYTDNCKFYFYKNNPPALSATTCWANSTNYTILVPFNFVNKYRTETNWTAVANNIIGFASEGVFSLGQKFPCINIEGYGLTWYSDSDCTTAITTCEDPNIEYYCKTSTEKVGIQITTKTAINCTLSITDDAGNFYSLGDGVYYGTTLQIEIIPDVGCEQIYIARINNTELHSGDSITVTNEIDELFIAAICYDGINVPINPTFEENSWTTIANAFKLNIGKLFWEPGDTKTIVSKSGYNYTIRIADMKYGRFDYSDGSDVSKCILEFVEGYFVNNTDKFYMYPTNSNNGGFATSNIKVTILEDVLADLPDELADVIKQINVPCCSGGSNPAIDEVKCKLFLPAEGEIFSSITYSIGISECPLGQFDYYASNDTDEAREKRSVKGLSYWYWLRSTYGSNSFCMVAQYGTADTSKANYNGIITPCFAL